MTNGSAVLERVDATEAGAEDPVEATTPGGIGFAFTRLFGGAVVGKVLGLGRELALAASFGTGTTAGALRAAQTATLIPAQFATGETLSAGLVPLWTRHVRSDPARANALFWAVSGVLLSFSILVTAALVLATQRWASFLFPGFGPDALRTTTQLLQVMAFGIPFYVQSAVFWYWEMAHGGYALAAARPTFQNVGMTAGIGVAWVTGNPVWLAAGFTSAYALLCLASPFWLARSHMLGGMGRVPRTMLTGAVREFWGSVRPLLLLPVLFQAGIALERALASLLGATTVASLDYAKVIVETGLALVAFPLGLASLAELGRMNGEAAKRRLAGLFPILLAIAIPASCALAIHARDVVTVLFGRGAFNADSIAVTAAVLTGLGIGLWAQLTAYVLGKALSARLRNREMAWYSSIGIVSMALIDILLFRPLGPLAFGLGSAAGSIVQLVLFCRALGLLPALFRGCARIAPVAALYSAIALGLVHFHAPLWSKALLFLAFFASIQWFVVPDARRFILARLSRFRRARNDVFDGPLGEGADS
jgi:peptidoglycan biosynthesis protein MviN/MurJ (putative lipid II flippase)